MGAARASAHSPLPSQEAIARLLKRESELGASAATAPREPKRIKAPKRPRLTAEAALRSDEPLRSDPGRLDDSVGDAELQRPAPAPLQSDKGPDRVGSKRRRADDGTAEDFFEDEEGGGAEEGDGDAHGSDGTGDSDMCDADCAPGCLVHSIPYYRAPPHPELSETAPAAAAMELESPAPLLGESALSPGEAGRGASDAESPASLENKAEGQAPGQAPARDVALEDQDVSLCETTEPAAASDAATVGTHSLEAADAATAGVQASVGSTHADPAPRRPKPTASAPLRGTKTPTAIAAAPLTNNHRDSAISVGYPAGAGSRCKHCTHADSSTHSLVLAHSAAARRAAAAPSALATSEADGPPAALPASIRPITQRTPASGPRVPPAVADPLPTRLGAASAPPAAAAAAGQPAARAAARAAAAAPPEPLSPGSSEPTKRSTKWLDGKWEYVEAAELERRQAKACGIPTMGELMEMWASEGGAGRRTRGSTGS